MRSIPHRMALALVAAPASANATVDYLTEIKPVLEESCYACHGALKQEAGLRVDTAQRIHDSGILDGELIERVTHGDPEERMPQEAKALEPESIRLIEEWIADGAPVPEHEEPDADPSQHWAFQRIERPAVPDSEFTNPIDAFLDAKHRGRGVVAQSRADRPILIRRLYLDLIGLPPSLDQSHDERPWGEIVDGLLASRHHGERWGRHWMDVWRYSDWYGLGKQLRNSQRHIWRWREWIVDSLNADKGYDRMVLEMLAGDEIAPLDPDTLRATGFLARNYYLFNRTTWIDSTIEHTGKAFLGLTLNCAKCHDHKYDPISQHDYYAFRAIFEPHHVRLDPVAGETDFDKGGLPRVYDDKLDEPTFVHRRGDPDDPDGSKVIPPGVPGLFASFAPPIRPVELPFRAYTPGALEHALADRLAAAEQRLVQAKQALDKAAAEEEQAKPAVESVVSDFAFTDEFDARDEQAWEINGDDWEFRDGSIFKTSISRENNVITLKRAPPRDFEVSLRYAALEGGMWKSIGIRFDRINEGQDQHQVYSSAYMPDPKLQVMHTVGGKAHYPRSGYSKEDIRLGETYELKLAVRDRLLNVWLNGDFVLAYQLPKRHENGQVAFTAFDCTARFDSISVRALDTDLELEEAGDGDSKTKLAEAEATVRWRGAEIAKVKAIAAAEEVRGEGSFVELATEAARAEAHEELARAQLDLLQAGGHNLRQKGARKRIAEAEDKLANPGTQFTAIHASRKALETPEHKFEQYPPYYPTRSTGRRLALANWLVHRDNPLTARVAVNHVWLRHFGEPLVETVEDFGRRAKRPEHAELLDWLAAEFIESGWSFRRLHRLMVTSETYQRSSSNAGAASQTREADPENALYWRANSRRMESQVVRDALLHLGGSLDLTMGGPSIDPAKGGKRRGLYFQHSRDQKDKLQTMFDDADFLQCYRRRASIVPQQALALANSKLAIEMADKIAERVAAEGGDFTATVFETVLCREPDGRELAACRQFVADLEASSLGEQLVRSRLVHALLNHNDFVTIR